MTYPIKFLSSREVARRLGMSARSLDRYRHAGKGPAYYKFGKNVRYKWSDVETWLKTQDVRPQRWRGRTR